VAGPEKHTFEAEADFKRYVSLFAEARAAGLGITVHTGETDATGPESVRQVLRDIKPERIGHGVQAVKDKALLAELAEAGTVLELCPSSNIQTHAVKSWEDYRVLIQTFADAGVKFTINTDGPYLLRTNLKKEIELLLEHHVMDHAEIRQAMRVARAASFIRS
jgi:adenosine deaminase